MSDLTKDLIWFSEAKGETILLHQLPVLFRALAPHLADLKKMIIYPSKTT